MTRHEWVEERDTHKMSRTLLLNVKIVSEQNKISWD
jgi:hypothetical protein